MFGEFGFAYFAQDFGGFLGCQPGGLVVVVHNSEQLGPELFDGIDAVVDGPVAGAFQEIGEGEAARLADAVLGGGQVLEEIR